MVKVGATLIEHSSTMHHGHQVANLQRQQNELLSQKQALVQQLAEKTALTDISQSINQDEYSTIGAPIVIAQATQIAASDL